ncbi:MAG TPA: hypothetical protein VFE62_30250 [Gemmataceae bacterium]|nr:hypothetical protein [Gemmataceae bacterium]
MNRSHLLIWACGILSMFALANMSRAQETPPAQPANNPIQVQDRGPLHDAIAQPFGVTPEPGPVVPNKPPAPIPEDPPEQKPDLPNVQWVPGYWAWDSDKKDYMWVSGVYRVPPQDRNYVPGYWSDTGNGYRWIPGFWASAKQQQVPYTPEPPATLDNGPTQPAPSDNALYVPGTWVWQQDRFVWQPGYWTAAQAGKVWTPASYVWTPNGYLYVDGYWDYPLQDRGLMFAPVTFAQPLWNNPSWRYQPSYVLPFNSFLNSAFVFGPSYYFGNYYNPLYGRAGYQPWYNGRGRYDPLFAYHGWHNHHGNANWIAGVQQTYANRSAGTATVPVHTATPLNQFAAGSKTNFVKTTPAQLSTQRTAIQHTNQLAVNRQNLETRGPVRGNEARALHLTNNAGHLSLSHPPAHVGGASISNRAYTPSTVPHIVNSASTAHPRTTITQPHIINSPSRTNVTPHLTTPSHIYTPNHMATPLRAYHPAPVHSGGVHIGGGHVGGGHMGGGHGGGHHR